MSGNLTKVRSQPDRQDKVRSYLAISTILGFVWNALPDVLLVLLRASTALGFVWNNQLPGGTKTGGVLQPH